MSISSLKRGLTTRLWVIDIPPNQRTRFSDLVIKWVECSGEEWTIKRLKSLKVDLFRMRAGLPPLTWVRKNRDGKWRGVLGTLFRYASLSEKNFRKVVQTLMCYTVFKHSKVTASQVKKFTTALRAAPPQISESFLREFSNSFRPKHFRSVDRGKDVSILSYRGSPSKRKPSRGFRSVPQDSNILDDLFLFEKEWGRQLSSSFPDLYGRVTEGLDHRPIQPPWQGGGVDVDPIQVFGGKIAFLQEPGGKLRSVASPFLVHQLALQHFGDAVYELARILPWDCTHDQSLPIPVLQNRLREGKTVHSVDLSAATDYFPLEVQEAAMRSLFGNIPDIHLFGCLSRSQWLSPLGTIRWRRGQPLGLYPSFAVFTVTHGMLLKFLRGKKWRKDNPSFYVLGDDVVILEDDLYHRYLETLESWSCPHSPDKSISSNQICEFAGKVITGESVTPQYKWREMSNDNFVDITRQLGIRSRILLTKNQKAVFDKIKHCTLPLGLNFSYPGSSLESMEQLTRQTLCLSERSVLDSLVDLAPVVNKNLYDSETPSGGLLKPTVPEMDTLLAKVKAFDEKADQVLGKILQWFVSDQRRNLSSVPEGAQPNAGLLPTAVLQPSRITALDRYNRILSG
jgi:hypothetical protein